MTNSKANPWQQVTLKLFYGGTFKKNENGSMSYLGRMNRTVGVEKDEFCWFTLLEEAEKCGNFRRNVDGIYYLNPKNGFQRALDDKDAQLMCEIAERDRVVNAYLVVDVDLAKLAELIEELRQPEVVNVPQTMVPRRKIAVNNKGSKTSKKEGPPITTQRSPLLCEAPPITPLKTTHINPPSKKNPTVTPAPLRTSRFTFKTNVDVVDDITIDDVYIEYEEATDSAQPIEDNEVTDEEEDDVSDPGYEPDLEEGYVDDEDEGFADQLNTIEEDFADEYLNEQGSTNEVVNEVLEQMIENDIAFEDVSNDEEAIEARKKLIDYNAKALEVAQQLQLEAESKLLSAQASDKVVEGKDQREGFNSDYDESGDEIHTPGESEEEFIPGRRRRSSIPIVNERTDFTKLKWSVGIRFPSREIFRDCVSRYAIAQGRNLQGLCQQMIVEEMNILTTVFLRFDNQKIIYPNSVLATKPISNYCRSPDMGDAIDFAVHISTPVEKIAIMKERITRYVENKREHWYPSPMIVMRDVEDMNRLKFSIWLSHTMNHQDMGERWTRRALLVEEMVKIFRDLDIEYRMLPMDVNVRTMSQHVVSDRLPSNWTACAK